MLGCGSSSPPPEEQAPAEGDTVTVGTLSVGVSSSANFRTMTLPSTGPVAFTAMYGSAIVRLQELRRGAQIAFCSYDGHDDEIYVMNADGSGRTNVTNNSAGDSPPAWSPDGGRIAFRSHDGSDWEIYVMDADGSGQTALTSNSVDDYDPAWSPDGSRIAFSSHDGSDNGGGYGIGVMNADGSGQTLLTSIYDWSPTWSPDGSRIAFSRSEGGSYDIWVMNADGSGQTNLTSDSEWDGRPAWSPDGSKIAFGSRPGAYDEIYVMNADGSAQTPLTNNSVRDQYPAWSPDGSRIAFSRWWDGSPSNIYVMNADGSGQTQLTNNPAYDHQPAWCPGPGVWRTVVGPGGADGDYDPPFGSARPCTIVGLRRAGMVSATTVTMSVPHWPSLGVEALTDIGTELTGVKLTGPNIKGIREDTGRGVPTQNWDVKETPATGAVLVFFDNETGKVDTVIASADKALSGRDMVASGGRLALRGTFTDVLTAPDTNLAMGSTREVVLDTMTGEVVELN